MRLFLLFLLVPLIEIALFIQVGGLIGMWPTLGIVILTAVLGTYLVRSQGLQAMANLRGSFEELQDPTEPLAHGAMILFSGALLLTPGFFTDAVGFALLVPGFRHAVFRYIKQRVSIQTVQYGTQAGPTRESGMTIDGDYEDLDIPPKDGPSGWTRH